MILPDIDPTVTGEAVFPLDVKPVSPYNTTFNVVLSISGKAI